MNSLNLTIAGQKYSLSIDDAAFIAESLRAAVMRPALHHDYSRHTGIGVVCIASGTNAHASRPIQAQHFGDGEQGTGTASPAITDC